MKDSLTAVQLRDVQDALRKPLSGRSVLIPLGSRAFVPGVLQPTLNEQQEEMIQLRERDSGELKTISRKEAIYAIQQDIQALKPVKPSTPTSSKKTPPLTETASSELKGPHKTETIAAAPNFFEIREEIDEQGQEVHSEAVNITKHLKLWENEVASGKTGLTVKPENVSATTAISNDDEVDENEGVERTGNKQVSDEEFAALSARLDELARLEEEEAAGKVGSRTSGNKKLQSKGWSKGFLNKSSKSKQKVAAPIAIPQTTKLSATMKTPVQQQQKSASKIDESQNSNNGRGLTVGFKDTNEVREIPRIGERSVSEVRKPAKPIHESVISDVVRERPRKSKQQDSANSKGNGSEEPKRLSRFAQQRLGHL